MSKSVEKCPKTWTFMRGRDTSKAEVYLQVNGLCSSTFFPWSLQRQITNAKLELPLHIVEDFKLKMQRCAIVSPFFADFFQNKRSPTSNSGFWQAFLCKNDERYTEKKLDKTPLDKGVVRSQKGGYYVTYGKSKRSARSC